ncbi:hypothetical protein RclHR1_05090013 [Rhizophagus clarus]|uniref:Protein kinase domain-containing protein n=1 Tax=Rhizophagus clarus TaxID=94130 RepID=A0A2Z6RKS6_9GLOM|nr:hypothetical protein RclHR1_05090013 [Rhizophagus clarus]
MHQNKIKLADFDLSGKIADDPKAMYGVVPYLDPNKDEEEKLSKILLMNIVINIKHVEKIIQISSNYIPSF